MKLYDSLHQKLITIKKTNQPIKIYACGPTVYNYPHIGNARAVISTDVLVSYLQYQGRSVHFIQNYTDIDDKIIDRALKEKKKEAEISEFYISAFVSDMIDLNVIPPTKRLAISKFIPEIIAFISALLDKNAAYEKDGNVYFDTQKYHKQYGKLAKKVLKDLTEGARVEINVDKKHPHDFVLWKKTAVGITYSSPWGEGRPGWHTECAVLIDQEFGSDTINIHAGGIDLIFPHHENERIQYLAKNGCEIADIWFHNGHLGINKVKMSKSLGNIITIREFVSQYGANSLRYIMYTTRYSQPLNLTEKVINHAQTEVLKIFKILKSINVYIATYGKILPLEQEGEEMTLVRKQLDNDLNLPNVLTLLDQLGKSLNRQIREDNINLQMAADYYNIVLHILNFKFELPAITAEIIHLLQEWKLLKQAKDYHKADAIRQKLMAENIL